MGVGQIRKERLSSRRGAGPWSCLLQLAGSVSASREKLHVRVHHLPHQVFDDMLPGDAVLLRLFFAIAASVGRQHGRKGAKV